MTFSHKTETNHRCSSFAASKKAVLQPSLGIASLAYEHGRVNKPAVSVMTFSSLQNPVCWAGKIHMSPMSDMLSLSFMAFQYVITSPRHARCGFTQKVQQRNPLIQLCKGTEPLSPSPLFSPTSVTTPTPPPPPLPPQSGEQRRSLLLLPCQGMGRRQRFSPEVLCELLPVLGLPTSSWKAGLLF